MARGMVPVVGTLDDAQILTEGAHAADAVINAASADHPGSVITLVSALKHRGNLLVNTTGSAIVEALNRDPAIGRAEALRCAMLAMIEDASDPWSAYPDYWGPFSVIGKAARQ